MNTIRTYPISTPDFSNLVAEEAIYIDKTAFVFPLVASERAAHYFLSRPRGFGKSLFLSTLEQVFLGNQHLFKGLYIYDKIDWCKKHAVIRLSFEELDFTNGLSAGLEMGLHHIATQYNVKINAIDINEYFSELIEKIAAQTHQQVVVLIDEYDQPIMLHLENEDTKNAEKDRLLLQDFLNVLKNSESYIHFVFITGTLTLRSTSLFSALNNLHDLTFDDNFATICGFTEGEVCNACAEGLARLAAKQGVTTAQIVDKMRAWYQGFSWNGRDMVYSSTAIMSAMHYQNFESHWALPKIPDFLPHLISEAEVYNFTKLVTDKNRYHLAGLQQLDYVALMLQMGYLTLKAHLGDNIYEVAYPNKEIELAFSKALLENHLQLPTGQAENDSTTMLEAFAENDIEKALKVVDGLFGALPYEYFKERYWIGEAFYHATLFWLFRILGLKMNATIEIDQNKIDVVVETDTHIYIFDLKKSRNATIVLLQIQMRKQAPQFAHIKKEIYLVSVAFNLRKRGISDWVMQKYR